MISIGAVFRGPELKRSVIWSAVGNLTRTIDQLRGPLREGQAPWVNAVYLVPGSLGGFEISHLAYGKFSTKTKGLVVQIPLPVEVASMAHPNALMIELLHSANAMAFHFFDERGETFQLRAAEALVQSAAAKM